MFNERILVCHGNAGVYGRQLVFDGLLSTKTMCFGLDGMIVSLCLIMNVGG